MTLLITPPKIEAQHCSWVCQGWCAVYASHEQQELRMWARCGAQRLEFALSYFLNLYDQATRNFFVPTTSCQ